MPLYISIPTTCLGLVCDYEVLWLIVHTSSLFNAKMRAGKYLVFQFSYYCLYDTCCYSLGIKV